VKSAAVCAGILGDSDSESRVRDFERNDGGVSTSVTPAAVCVGIGGERESDSRERDFERSRGGIGTSVKPAVVCVGILGDSDSESRVRDFERTGGDVCTSVKLPGAVTDKLDDGKDTREAKVDTSGLGLTLEPMTRGAAARRAEPWPIGATSPVFGERATDPITD